MMSKRYLFSSTVLLYNRFIFVCVSFSFLNVRLRAEHPGRSLVGHRHHDNGTLYLLLRRFFSFIISSFFQYSGEFHRAFLSDIIITSNLFPEYFFYFLYSISYSSRRVLSTFWHANQNSSIRNDRWATEIWHPKRTWECLSVPFALWLACWPSPCRSLSSSPISQCSTATRR